MKKWTILLVLVLVVSVFAGCQPSGTDVPAPQNTPAPQAPESNPTVAPTALPLTKQTAVQFALDHVGAANEDVKHLHTRLDTDENGTHYDVDFRYGEFSYEFELDVQTGEIIKLEKDHIDADLPLKNVTSEQAQEIALEHAGLTSDSVRTLTVEFDREEHYYEVEFKKDGYEYSYEICAEYGKILDADKDWDD